MWHVHLWHCANVVTQGDVVFWKFYPIKKIITNKPPFHSTKQEICEQGSGSQWKVWLHCVTGHAVTAVQGRTEACGGTFCSSVLSLCHAERYKSLKFFVWEDVIFFWKYAQRKNLRRVFSKYLPWCCIMRQAVILCFFLQRCVHSPTSHQPLRWILKGLSCLSDIMF